VWPEDAQHEPLQAGGVVVPVLPERVLMLMVVTVPREMAVLMGVVGAVGGHLAVCACGVLEVAGFVVAVVAVFPGCGHSVASRLWVGRAVTAASGRW
jgi:hypothetical protein